MKKTDTSAPGGQSLGPLEMKEPGCAPLQSKTLEK